MTDQTGPIASSRDRKRRENHDRLFQAAIEEFERVGYEHARIEHICQKSEVTRPTFYAHFTSKEGVLSELQLRHFQSVADELCRRTKSALDLDGVIEALIDSCFRASGLVSEQLRREILSYLPRFQQMSEWDNTELFAILVHSFDRARQSREINGFNPRDLALDVMAIINGFIIADPAHLDAAERGARRSLRLYLEGLRANARAASTR